MEDTTLSVVSTSDYKAGNPDSALMQILDNDNSPGQTNGTSMSKPLSSEFREL
jgi:hypothetical protein